MSDRVRIGYDASRMAITSLQNEPRGLLALSASQGNRAASKKAESSFLAAQGVFGGYRGGSSDSAGT
jgi:hypothetical protein